MEVKVLAVIEKEVAPEISMVPQSEDIPTESKNPITDGEIDNEASESDEPDRGNFDETDPAAREGESAEAGDIEGESVGSNSGEIESAEVGSGDTDLNDNASMDAGLNAGESDVADPDGGEIKDITTNDNESEVATTDNNDGEVLFPVGDETEGSNVGSDESGENDTSFQQTDSHIKGSGVDKDMDGTGGNTEVVLTTASLMHFSSAGMSAAMALPVIEVMSSKESDEAEDQASSGSASPATAAETDKIYASIELQFDDVPPNLLSQVGTPLLSTEGNKKIFDISESAKITVSGIPEGASSYYVVINPGEEDKTPNETNGTKIDNGEFTVTAPNSDDGGVVTVKVVFATGDGADRIFSETTELQLSFYNLTKNSGHVMSLNAQDSEYYFNSVENAFLAVDDENIDDEVTLKVLKTASVSYASKTSIFKNAAKVAIDLNGQELTLSCSSGIVVEAPEFSILDTVSDSNSVLKLSNTGISTNKANDNIVKIENVRVEITDYKSGAITLNNTDFCISQSNFQRTGESEYGAIIYLANGSKGTISESYISDQQTTANKGYAIQIASNSELTLENCFITANRYVVNMSSNTSLVVDGGKYICNGNTNSCYVFNLQSSGAKVTFIDGIAYGTIRANNVNASFEIQNGYFWGPWSEKANGLIFAPHSTSDVVISGDYQGFTKYTLRQTAIASVSFSTPEGVATLNQDHGENLTVYIGEEMEYTVTCLTGYEVSEIAYNGQSISLESDENWNAETNTYKLTVPEGGFSLSIVVKSVTEGGEPVAQIGETTYTSLTDAMLALNSSDDKTLKLLQDVEHSNALEFSALGATLDLNGNTLTFKSVQPQSSSPSESYCILVSNGSLTIADLSEEKTGMIVFSTDTLVSGIRVDGTNTKLNINGGTLKGLNSNDFCFMVTCMASEGEVTVTGGTVYGAIWTSTSVNSGKVVISGNDTHLYGNTRAIMIYGSAELEISGGEIRTSPELSTSTTGVVLLSGSGVGSDPLFTMTGGSVRNYSGGSAIEITNISGTVQISENAEVIADNGNAIAVYNGSQSGTITISDDAKIKGSTYAVWFQDGGKSQTAVFRIDGGYFSYGENSIPLSDSYYVTYPEGKVLDVTPVGSSVAASKGLEGDYYALIDTSLLGGTYQPSAETGLEEIEYGYQDFDGYADGSCQGLRQLTDSSSQATKLYGTQNNDDKYAVDAWNTFANAYELALRCLTNKNANQVEIDYRKTQLSAAMIAMTTATTVDPATLADGTYEIQVGLWKSGMSSPSMANGALDSTALLIKEGNTYTLQMNFGPTRQYSIYGHLMDFYIYNGDNYDDTYYNMRSDTAEGKDSQYATEAVYSNWYAGSGTTNAQTFAKDEIGEDRQTEEYNLPGTVTITLPYVGTSSDKYAYWCGMTVDAMGGYASAILMLTWSNLISVETVDTLSVSSENVYMSLHDKGVKTAEVVATVSSASFGSSGWTISCEEQIEDGQTAAGIATASVTGNTITFTAVKEGTSTFVVTASKDGADPLTKEITVTVTNDAPFVADINVSGSTARIDISGSSLSGANEGITSTSSRITIDATSSNSQVSQAVITIDTNTMTALLSALDRLGSTSPSLRFETDVGQLTLGYDVVENAASYGQDITLEIGEIDIPDIDGLSDSDFETAYELTMSYGSRNISSLGGEVTITVSWDEDVGYAYYVDGDELAERYAMTVSGGSATWITDHFSTWALSTDRNLMEVGITEGVYSVPIVIKQADAPSRDSMANDAVGDMVVADVDEDGVTYTMFLKVRIGDELGGEPLRGHLLKMWYYAPDDTSRSNPIRATVVRTYEDRDMNGDMDTFPREVEVYQEGEPNEDYYIQVSVDAMGGDSALQDALVRLDWDNALDDGGDAAREGFVDEYATEQVIDSGDSVSRSDLSDWIDEEYTLLVQGDDTYLTARFDTDALEDLYDQTSSSIKFVLDEVKKSNLTDEQQEVAGDRPVYQLKITSGSKTITEIDDGTVEVTLPYELQDDENKDGLVIWLVDEDGGIQSIKFSYNSSREYVSFDTTEFGVFVIGYDAEQIWENPFTDVSEDDWFYDAVKYVVQKEMFAGTSETTFEPNLTMSRAMLVTVLYRMDGTPEVSGSSKFADVLDGQYYTDAVLWATENGIVAGYDNGLFGTNDIVSRQQMATFLYRYAQYKGYDVSLVKGLENYTDSSTVASYAIRPMQWAVANGLINGTSATTLTPTGGATRAQVAVILMRFDEAIVIPAQEKAAEETEE